VLDALQELAGEVGASVAAVSLAWVRQRSEVISTLIGARTTAQLDANLESLAVTIPEESMSKLDELTKPDLNYPFEWLATLAAPVQQSGATVNGVTTPPYKRKF
jgi:aryl-alcohol dehydrogenase-like predicted oxidoreductase